MNDLRKTTIGDVCDVFDGPHATPKKIDSGPIFLSISSLVDGRLDLSKSACISEEDFVKWTKRVTPRVNDLVFSYETRLGDAALIPENLKCCLGRRIALMRINDTQQLDPKYLLYYYLSPTFQNLLKERTVFGSTVNRIPLKEVPDFPLLIPDIHTQKAVTYILGAIDDQIMLNQRKKNNLEKTMNTIFKSWFVDFEPVQEKGIHTSPMPEIYSLFSGEFINSEIGEIPKDWMVMPIGSAFKWNEGKTWKKENRSETGTINVFGANGSVGFSLSEMHNDRVIFVGKIGSCGALNFHNGPFWVTNNAFYLLQNENKFFEFCRYTLMNIDFTKYIGGSSNPYMPFKNFSHHKIIYPTESILEKFEYIALKIQEKIELTNKQNIILSELRDILLPRLISGELKIPYAENLIEEATN